MKRDKAQKRFMVFMILPAFIMMTCFVALPGIRALFYSLQKWNGMSTPEWVGLANFRKLLTDTDVVLPAIGHSIFLMVTVGSLTMFLALSFAAMLHRKVRGAGLFRVTFFFPNIIAAVAIALLWVLLYSATDFGVINGLLAWAQEVTVWSAFGFSTLEEWFPSISSTNMFYSMVPESMKETVIWSALGLPAIDMPYPFLDSTNLLYAMVPMLVWAATGFYMVLFLAGMQSIPESYYEAAKLDGATGIQQFFFITVPLMREVITVGLVFMVINLLKIFDPIWIMENERPNKESHVLSTVLYQRVFTEFNVGYGSSVAVLLFVMVFVATLISLRLSRRERLEY